MADISVPLNRVGVVVSADGKSAEIHPVATGTGDISVSGGSLGEPSIPTQSRSVEITSNASDPGDSGTYPKFTGIKYSIVHPAGRLV